MESELLIKSGDHLTLGKFLGRKCNGGWGVMFQLAISPSGPNLLNREMGQIFQAHSKVA